MKHIIFCLTLLLAVLAQGQNIDRMFDSGDTVRLKLGGIEFRGPLYKAKSLDSAEYVVRNQCLCDSFALPDTTSQQHFHADAWNNFCHSAVGNYILTVHGNRPVEIETKVKAGWIHAGYVHRVLWCENRDKTFLVLRRK